jgi:UDP-glucose 6-dehydrogenase
MVQVSVFGIKDRLGAVLATYLASMDFSVKVSERSHFPFSEEPNLASLNRKFKSNIEFVDRDQFRASPFVLLALDTPVDEGGKADYRSINRTALLLRNRMKAGSVLMISSQVNVGFCDDLTNRKVGIAYWPENIRRGRALESLERTHFYAVGVDTKGTKIKLHSFFSSIPAEIHFCDLRTAESSKVFLNGFLATCISYANEVARLCLGWAVSTDVVYRHLVNDYRVGRHLPLKGGKPYLGPLERDIEELRRSSKFFESVRSINESVKK